jgi:hypothetical protein
MGALYPDLLDGQRQMVFVTDDAGRTGLSSVRQSSTEMIARCKRAQGDNALGIILGSAVASGTALIVIRGISEATKER